MNPLTNVRNIAKLNEQELNFGIFDDEKSWHSQYKDSAYIFIGGLPYELTEGDILCVFSQYGELININLVRDKKSGKSKGYGFIAYEDQRSTILAVDNLNGIKLGGRTIRVDHVQDYRRPKGNEKDESGKYKEIEEVGCAPKTPSASEEESGEDKKEKRKKLKKERKEKKMKKAKKKDKRKEDEDGRIGIGQKIKSETAKNKSSNDEITLGMTKKGRNKGRDYERREQLDRYAYREKMENERHREKERRRQEDRDYMPSKHKTAYRGSSDDKPRERKRSRSPSYRR